MTSEQTCKTCRFWVGGFGDPRACVRMGGGPNGPRAIKPVLVTIATMHGAAVPFTRGDFGCVMWEPRHTENDVDDL